MVRLLGGYLTGAILALQERAGHPISSKKFYLAYLYVMTMVGACRPPRDRPQLSGDLAEFERWSPGHVVLSPMYLLPGSGMKRTRHCHNAIIGFVRRPSTEGGASWPWLPEAVRRPGPLSGLRSGRQRRQAWQATMHRDILNVCALHEVRPVEARAPQQARQTRRSECSPARPQPHPCPGRP